MSRHVWLAGLVALALGAGGCGPPPRQEADATIARLVEGAAERALAAAPAQREEADPAGEEPCGGLVSATGVAGAYRVTLWFAAEDLPAGFAQAVEHLRGADLAKGEARASESSTEASFADGDGLRYHVVSPSLLAPPREGQVAMTISGHTPCYDR